MKRNSGLTLVELMIAVALVAVGILVAALSYTGIQKSIQSSKGRTLASNIAQEKMQILMQKSYYEVLATTAPLFIVEPSTTIPYDSSYFPPEIVPEGGMSFTRYTYIQPVIENSGQIQSLPPSTSDTGMRQISITVLWKTNSGDKFLTIQNVLNNPNTVMSNSVLQGVVRDTVTLVAIPNALVNAAENIGWRDTSDATGNYRINLSPGTFDFQASAPGYYSKITTLSLATNASTSFNFFLRAISSGTVAGSVWITNHLVISQVVASTGPANGIEYVELYNPTTNAILMGSNATVNTPNIWPIVWDSSNNGLARHLHYVAAGNSVIPSYGYYLISNTGNTDPATSCSALTVGGVTKSPDACWLHVPTPNLTIECGAAPCPTGGNPWSGSSPDAGGISLGSASSVIGTSVDMGNWPGNRIDSVGWAQSGAGHAAPANAVERLPIQAIFGGGIGLPQGEQFVRRMTTATISGASGRAYDANINLTDFSEIGGISVLPNTTATVTPPAAGTPATGAIVSINDGTSVPSSATLTGSPPYAQFNIPGVATGTWTLFADSGTVSAENDTVNVVTNSTTSLYNTFLTTVGVVGVISGRVNNALGSPLSGILVSNTAASVTTGANGTFFMRVSTGVYDVIANPGNANALYESVPIAGVPVTLGDVTSNVNFALSQGGRLRGWVSRDGLNPLPGVAVVALDVNGIAQDTEVTGTNGQFLLINLSTGTYTVSPVLDQKETSSPNNASAAVTAGVTTWVSSYTVLGAMGTVTGRVTNGGQAIRSGVLIVASTTTITNPLPTLNISRLTQPALYGDSSMEDGTYSLDVRGSTTSVYNLVAFYTTMVGATPVTSTRTVSGITATAGAVTSGVNFTW